MRKTTTTKRKIITWWHKKTNAAYSDTNLRNALRNYRRQKNQTSPRHRFTQ